VEGGVQGLPGGVALHLDGRMGSRILSCRRQQTAISIHIFGRGLLDVVGRSLRISFSKVEIGLGYWLVRLELQFFELVLGFLGPFLSVLKKKVGE
jgi:hypothetical protein